MLALRHIYLLLIYSLWILRRLHFGAVGSSVFLPLKNNRMRTSTNTFFSMHPLLPPSSNQALATLHRGGLVLLPTANLWQVISHPHFPETHDRLFDLCPPQPEFLPELLFSDLAMLKRWAPNLHPKLETLLLYHKRPLTLLLPEVSRAPAALRNADGLLAVRLIQDAFCRQLCEDLELPLVASLALAPGARVLPTSFGRIRSDVLASVDFIVQRRQKEWIASQTALTICLDENDELVFVNE
ncbi:MAG: hypothetical protein HC821_01170 [Lewinella sp.]|nr:hypothetical protein [Lewinella sp.]